MNLSEMACRYDTDKAVNRHYLEAYEEWFGPLRSRPVSLLELGVHRGGSLRLWHAYFASGTIAGLDLARVPALPDCPRVHLFQGRQDDTRLLARITGEIAADGFDIIIDDCAHVGELSRRSFAFLFARCLKPGGIYVIEDWGTGYWPDWPDGGRVRPVRRSAVRQLAEGLVRRLPLLRCRPRVQLLPYWRQRHSSHLHGMVGFVKQLVDHVGRDDQPDQAGAPAAGIACLEFRPGQVLVRKAAVDQPPGRR